MASARQTIGAKLGVSIRTIKTRVVNAFIAARPFPNTKLSANEQNTVINLVWQALGAALTPISPTGTVIIGTAKDANGDEQLTLDAGGGHYDIPISIPVALANGLIPRVLMVRPVSFPAGLEGSLARIFTAPSSNGTVNIRKNDAAVVATAALIASSNDVVLASAGFSMVAGDWLSIDPPTDDITAANFSITLMGFPG